MYEVKVIADSICNQKRLTTMQLTHPRIVHAEFMTHCMFARNASSSRAIPFEKMVKSVQNDPFFPVWWGKNQSGMQAREELSHASIEVAKYCWITARDNAIEEAEAMNRLGLHKQICNRLLEPWGWITCCVTGDSGAWSNYFALRCHVDAQPEIQKQAYMARDAYFSSTPEQLEVGRWHTPYIRNGEFSSSDEELKIKISVGRCARTSYLTQEGVRDETKDIELHDRLKNSRPMHASPFEHVCVAIGVDTRYGKYIGWKSYRHMIHGEYVTDFSLGCT